MKPVRVKASVTEETLTLCAIYCGGIALSATSLSAYPALAWLPLVLGVALFTVISQRHRRLKGLEVQIDEEGVSSLIDGRVVCSVPWSRYGGFREHKVPRRVRLWYPERCGIELLDKQGVVMGVVPLEKGSRARVKQTEVVAESIKRGKLFHELERRSLDWKEPEPTYFSVTQSEVRKRYAYAATFLAPGLGLLALTIYMSKFGADQMAWSHLAGTVVPCLVCFVALGVGLVNLFRAELGRKWLRNPIQLELFPMGRWDEVLETRFANLDRTGTEPGHRYQFATARQTSLLEKHLMHFFLLCFSPLLLVLLFFDSGHTFLETLNLVGMLSLMLVGLAFAIKFEVARVERDRNDVLVRTHEGLVVLRSDGSHLSFGTNDLRGPRKSAIEADRRELWGKGRHKYTISLRDLVEIEEPDDAVKAELEQMISS